MRPAFAVATEVDPQILIVDEIFGVGDAGFPRKCFDRILGFREAGKTILFVPPIGTRLSNIATGPYC